MKRMSYNLGVATLSVGMALAIGACGEDDDTIPPVESLDGELVEAAGHICGHLVGGPFESVNAAPDATDALGPDHNATFEHTAVTTMLISGAGFVHLDIEEEGEFAIGLSSNIPLSFTHEGAAVTPEESFQPPSNLCSDLAIVHVIDLEAGEIVLEFGPSSESDIVMVVESLGEHDHGDDHDHDHDDDHDDHHDDHDDHHDDHDDHGDDHDHDHGDGG